MAGEWKNKHDFWNSDAGKITNYRDRKRNRVSISLQDIEPQSKKMPDAQKDKFQKLILRELADVKRAAFKRPVALRLDICTTERTAPQAHTIAKNILDLLSNKRPTVKGKYKKILYQDDSQIHALSVSCRHGEKHPNILIEARSFTSLLKDFELAAEAMRVLEENNPAGRHEDDRDFESVESFKELLRDEAAERRRLGDDLYDAMVKMERWYAQRALLRRAALNTAQLWWLYAPAKSLTSTFGAFWSDAISRTPLRIQIGELPTKRGSSDAFIRHVDQEVKAFKAKWDWLIRPLVIPVALEVVVRPSPSTPKGVLHDLDNVVRDYIIPKIVPTFGTVTDHRWTIDFEDLKRRDPSLATRWEAHGMPPKGTRAGVPKYEAWRLPVATRANQGFVSVAMVATDGFVDDRFYKMDHEVECWSKIVDDEKERRRW